MQLLTVLSDSPWLRVLPHTVPAARPVFAQSVRLVFATAVFLIGLSSGAQAANFQVTNLNDSGSGSLREAVTNAADNDTITFDPGLSGIINLASKLTPQSVTFVNAEDISLKVSGATAVPLLDLTGPKTLSQLSANMSVTATNDGAYGMRSNADLTILDNLSGTIVASTGGEHAYGVQANTNLDITGDVSGAVAADSTTRHAYALWTRNAMTIGAISGSLTATADTDEAYGLLSNSDLLIHGVLSGTVSANAGQNGAGGLWSNADLKIAGISGTITATAGNNHARGIRSAAAMTIDGDLTGTVKAKAGGSGAFGLLSETTLTITGDLSGIVSAESKNTDAYAVWSRRSMTIDALSGDVTAQAGTREAYGLLANSSLNITNGLSGTIAASTGRNGTGGVWTNAGLNISGGLSGTVTATAGGRFARGVRSAHGMSIAGGVSGTVTAKANQGGAYGLWSGYTMEITGGLSGTVSAEAGGSQAYGIYSAKTINNGSGGALDISGSVSSKAKGLAVAVGALEGLNLNVTGRLTAEDTSGSNKAYAIAAGRETGGNWTPGGAYDDTVTLGNGAQITGMIDLGGGTNILNFVGAGIVNGVVRNGGTMTKSGSGKYTIGALNGTSLDVRDGTLEVRISQIATPTIVTTGVFNNDGQVTFRLNTNVAAGTTFTAARTGGVTGSGIWDTPLTKMKIVGNDIRLTKLSYSDKATRGNHAFANALDSYAPTASGDFKTILDTLNNASTTAALNDCFEQLEGVAVFELTTQIVDMSRFSSLSTQQRMAEVRTYHAMLDENQSPTPGNPDSWPTVAAVGDVSGMLGRTPDYRSEGVHLRMLGRTGNMESHSNLTGYDYKSLMFSGGYDTIIDDGLLLGISGGYSATNANYKDTGESDSSVDSYTLGVYSSWFADDWYLDALVSGSYNVYDINREIPFLNRTAKSDPNGYTLATKFAGGKRYKAGDYGLTPVATLEYTRFHQEKYTETGAGAANLTVDSADSNFLESGLGGKIDRAFIMDWGYLIPEVSAMWQHEWLTQNRALTYSMSGMPGTAVAQEMAQGSKDSALIGAGFQALLESGHALSLHYNAEVEEHALSQSFQLDLLFTF